MFTKNTNPSIWKFPTHLALRHADWFADDVDDVDSAATIPSVHFSHAYWWTPRDHNRHPIDRHHHRPHPHRYAVDCAVADYWRTAAAVYCDSHHLRHGDDSASNDATDGDYYCNVAHLNYCLRNDDNNLLCCRSSTKIPFCSC